MELHAYLSFNGDCEEAFTFYQDTLGGRLGELFRYGGSPLENGVPPEWSNKIMHGSVAVAGHVLMGADLAPERYERPKGFSLSLNLTNAAEADRVFDRLAAGGTVVMPLEKTFWAERFGAVVDRFGIQWQVNCEGRPDSSPGAP